MAQFLTIGRHFECAIQTELVVELELALIERKQSRRFRHNSMPKIYERVHVGWHCAKVKGHAELNIEKPSVKTLSRDIFIGGGIAPLNFDNPAIKIHNFKI